MVREEGGEIHHHIVNKYNNNDDKYDKSQKRMSEGIPHQD